jgi:DNA-directed RNA polymerase specialized sigma24 family protein
MNRYKQSLFDLIYKFVGEYHKAEDILQQVWLKLYLSLAIDTPKCAHQVMALHRRA